MEQVPKPSHSEDSSEEETKTIDGKKYHRVNTGYTIREFFSHETPEKGAGPGWDTRERILEQYKVHRPEELPNTPYYQWEPIEE